MTDDLEVRRWESSDEEQTLALLSASLGWMPDDVHRDFFRWKHFQNPAGVSPAWVAVVGDRLAGVRFLLRWRFRDAKGTHDAVRAVDTATHPDHQGKGIFTRLTRAAVEQLTAEGVRFVFNTPNAQSLPGYLKMGWTELGRVPIAARPRTPASLVRMARSRAPAELWSTPCPAFEDPRSVFADDPAVAELLSSVPTNGALATDRTPRHLRWRYGFEPLRYRAALATDDVTDGVVVFRLRRRGAAVEAAICEVLLPDGDPSGARRIVGRILRRTGADYAVAVGPNLRTGMVPLPGQGPLLTRRPLADPRTGSVDDFSLSLGDVELL